MEFVFAIQNYVSLRVSSTLARRMPILKETRLRARVMWCIAPHLTVMWPFLLWRIAKRQ